MTGQGREAEAFAELWLEQRGWSILERNYRWRNLEIDIIASRAELIAFIEVKFASDGSATMPMLKVDSPKRHRLATAAAAYLGEKEISRDCRFDVAIVRGVPGEMRMEYIPEAFRPQDLYTV